MNPLTTLTTAFVLIAAHSVSAAPSGGVVVVGLGQRCGGDSPFHPIPICDQNLVCRSKGKTVVTSVGVCVPSAGVGEACGGPDPLAPWCEAGLQCKDLTYRARDQEHEGICLA